MKSRLMSYVVYRDYHFAENLIYFNRSDWAMYRNSDEIDIDIYRVLYSSYKLKFY